VPAGRIEIAWTIDENENNERLHLTWTEKGGPPGPRA
jgi:two-component sensor histidine kinase